MEITGLSTHILSSDDDLQNLVECARDWALLHGMVRRSNTSFSTDSVTFVPFTLVPSPFPRNAFENAKNIQTVLNKLMHDVAHDHEFLTNSLKKTIEVDSFTKKLFDIYEIVYNEGIVQPISLGLFRSDYMLDVKEGQPVTVKQVEFNTISTSLAGISSRLSILHRIAIERLQCFQDLEKLPENFALSGMAEGLLEAWKAYNNPSAIILFVVEDVTLSIGDQRLHEFELYRLNPKITILRRSLTKLVTSVRLAENRLYVETKEVAVVYYRTAYVPEQYATEKEWNVRLLMERSAAIKCPSIQYQLAGTKKIQQTLASKTVLKRFIDDDSTIELVMNFFAGLYTLDFDTIGDDIIEKAIKNPNDFVLKPQREGGGNNVYGDEIAKVLSEIRNSKERMAYILMNKLTAPVQSSYIVRVNGEKMFAKEDIVSELGIYGVFLGTKDKIFVNKQVGHLLRSKNHSLNEIGIAAGFGCVDSPFLY